MSWAAIIPLLLALQVTPPQVQVGTGSAMFIVYANDNFTVAADSRRTLLPEGHDDTECKISAFGDKFIFAMTGVVIRNSSQNGHLVAREIWKTKSSETDATRLVSGVAEEWTQKMEKLYQSVPVGTIRQRTGGDALATADFAATDKLGQMAAVSVEIGFDGKSFDRSGQVRITHHIQTLRYNQWYAAGLQEISTEYAKQTSNRAKEYMTKFNATIAALPPSEQDAKLAAKYIELSILLHPKKIDLAFPVDVLQLKRTVGVDWVSVKPNCPRN